MKEYVVDLELAKELEDNGFPQKSLYSWFYTDGWGYNCWGSEPPIYNKKYTAPCSDEILKELPKYIEINNNIYWLILECRITGNMVYYGNLVLPHFNCKKLSNALAKMWLYLKKEGLL